MRMTTEQAKRVMDLCEQYAWMMKHKAPHLTHEEMTSEFHMVCLTIFKKYGFQEPLFKRACHAKLVDLVRAEYRYGTLAMEDTELEIGMNNCEPSETTSTEASHESLESKYESESLLSGLRRYLEAMVESNESWSKYLHMRLFLEGFEYDESMYEIFKSDNDSTVIPSRGVESVMAHELGYSNGSSSGGYKLCKFKIQLFVAYYMHVNDLEEYLPLEWRDLGEDYYAGKRELNKAREYLGVTVG